VTHAPGPGGDRYPVPAREHRVEAEIQRSRFITTVAPAPTVDDAVRFVRRVSEEFADATHNCWAYVVGPPGSTAHIGMSDDGEPHGTAGRPMLTVLLHADVGDVAAVVTRYYGGTKLGTGGLARAYSGGVQDALLAMPRAERVELVELTVQLDYGHVDALRQLLPSFEAEVAAQEFLARVTYTLRLPRAAAARFRRAVADATRGQGVVQGGEEHGH
jgi:uncharacterized YigZ family protein